MAISLYDATVRSFLQTLDALSGLLDKGLAHFEASGTDPNVIVETRLFPDMLPFRFQVQMAMHHSLNATRAALSGNFTILSDKPDHDYAGLQALIADTRAALRTIAPEDVNASEGGDVVFSVGDFRQAYTTEDFLLSLSLPNFYFHVSTAYDLLRLSGVPIGKRDYLGAVRTKE